jgi:Metallo-peptidase family M12B Reprolysin-like
MRFFPVILSGMALLGLVAAISLVQKPASVEHVATPSVYQSVQLKTGPEQHLTPSATSENLRREEHLGHLALNRSILASGALEIHTLVIPLGKGHSGRLVLDRKAPFGGGEDAWQWTGKLSGDALSSVVLTSWKGTVFGTITGAEGTFELRQISSGDMEVIRIEEAALPDCGVQEGDALAEGGAVASELAGTDQDGSDTRYVDIVVAYNDQARVALGGAAGVPTDNAAIEAKIITSVANANIAYANSDVDMVMRLAWLGMIDYTYPTTENFSRALTEIANVSDGNADVLAQKKALYQADFASLWVANSVTGGLANVLTSSAQKTIAYSVIRAQNPTITFVHEVGHNMGCRHLRSSYPTTPSSWTSYAFAHSFTGSDGKVYTDAMASTEDAAALGATRLLYFSNPSISYLSTPTGVANQQDCAKTLRDNRVVYEGFFPAPAISNTMDAASGIFTFSLSYGFVGRSYQLWRTADLTLAPSNWTLLGESTTDDEGNISRSDNPGGASKVFYQWRR